MATDSEIHDALERVVNAFKKRPGMARSTDRTTARLEDGLKCVTKQGDWTFELDMPTVMGGEYSGPSPGFFGRSALIGCVAIGIKMTAARAGVPIKAIDVEVEMDWDDSGLFGFDEVSAGCLESRLKIAIDSPAPDEIVHELVSEALKNSPWLITFVEAQTFKTDVVIKRTATGTE